MKIFKYLAAALTAVALCGFFTACESDEDFLKEKSYKFDDLTFYNTETDMILGLNSAYAKVQSIMLNQLRAGHSWMLMGWGLDTFAQTSSTDHFSNWSTLTEDSGYARHWYDYLYALINRANTIIDMIDERSDVQYSTSTRKAELRGEALFIRSFAYRCLVGMYGRCAYLDHRTTEANFGYQLNTREDVWQHLKEDFARAEKDLPTTPRLTGTVTKAAAATYLAEVCICLGDFQDAVDAATRVINKNDGNYQIMTTRFGSRKDEAVDRYGNPLNPYWDLFRGSWGRDAMTGNGVKKADVPNQNSPENLEAIWVCQYNYGTFETGGGGDAWWRTHKLQFEANWLCNFLTGNATQRTLSNGKYFLFYGPSAGLLPAGEKGSTLIDGERYPEYAGRYLASGVPRDSIGGCVTYFGQNCLPTEYVARPAGDVYGSVWDDPNDFRGCETMVQRNFYTPGGERWYDVKKGLYERAAAAVGTADESVYALKGGDTTAYSPRFWKVSTDVHPEFESQHQNDRWDVQWYMIRMPEVYLLRAEAYLGLGNKASAAADINTVRSRANAKPCTAAQVDIDYILDERTRELFIEEHRMVTLSRLSCNPHATYALEKYPVQNATTSNTAYERMRKYGFGYENVAAASQPRESYTDILGKTRHYSNFKPHNYVLPIPGQVIRSNNKFEITQNEGY